MRRGTQSDPDLPLSVNPINITRTYMVTFTLAISSLVHNIPVKVTEPLKCSGFHIFKNQAVWWFMVKYLSHLLLILLILPSLPIIGNSYRQIIKGDPNGSLTLKPIVVKDMLIHLWLAGLVPHSIKPIGLQAVPYVKHDPHHRIQYSSRWMCPLCSQWTLLQFLH